MICEDSPRMGFQLKAMNNLIRRRLDVRFCEVGLGDLRGMQGPMIGYIYEHSKNQDIFQKDIEREFNIRRSTATVMLQNLEQKELIVRQAVNYDARLKKIVLTDKAVQCHFYIHEQIDAFNRELEEGITVEEKEQFFRILAKIEGNLKKSGSN